MVPFTFGLIFPITLNFSKVRSFIMRGKIYRNFLIVACKFLLILFNASFDDDIHVLIGIAFFIYFGACVILLKCRVIKYFPSLF